MSNRRYSNGRFSKWGNHNIVCDRTGFKTPSDEASREWNGLLVRKESWEIRHPQDWVKPKYDKQSVKNARPESTDVFLEPGDVTVDDL